MGASRAAGPEAQEAAPHPVLGIVVVLGLLASLALLSVAPPDWPMFQAP